jgi:nitrogen-specific signal transduction histidine kinase
LNLIIRETDRLNSVLQGYLTMSRRPVLHPINIHEVIETVLSIMNISRKNGNISVQRLYDPSLPKLIGDEGKLFQVFVNIIKNAIEAMPRGGTLSITTKPSNEYVVQHGQIKRWAVISVNDTGKGIPKNEMQKIFLPFYTKKKKGTGLGLSLSKKIVKDHSGFIRSESPPASGKGTAFHIYIPFADT